MKIKFEISKEYEREVIYVLLRGDDWKYRAERMEIAESWAEKIHKSPNKEMVQDSIDDLVESTYRVYLPYMEKTKELYRQSWEEVIDEFSRIVEEVTEPWLFEEYICVITHFSEGVSNHNGNIIGRWWKENPYLQRRLTAHEILMVHYFSIVRKDFPNHGLTDNQIWTLAEIAAFALTGLEKRISVLLPYRAEPYYFDHNYPQIIELQKELKEPFLKKNDFKEYVEAGIKMVRKYN